MKTTFVQKAASGSFTLFGGWTGDQKTPIEQVIPAVPGEYYGYSSKFTADKPLYTLLKCKSNKFWTIASAAQLGAEANLLFCFDSTTHAQVCAIKTAQTLCLLGDATNADLFGETWIAPAKITAEEFYGLHAIEKIPTLVDICSSACAACEVSADLKPGAVIAMMTDKGKYGMFLVRRLTPMSVHIDACHILMP
ncbi:MAG: hypothetical protein WCO09_00490 [bacterium]